jgi:hypothetical protein
MRTLFPGARLGNCLRHALTKIPKKLTAIASPVRTALRSQFHTFTADQHEPFNEFPAEDFPQPTERTGVIHEVILHREQMPPGSQERHRVEYAQQPKTQFPLPSNATVLPCRGTETGPLSYPGPSSLLRGVGTAWVRS